MCGDHVGRGGRLKGLTLAGAVIERAQERWAPAGQGRLVARDSEAIRFFHSQRVEATGQIELILDLVDRERWKPRERIAGRDFRV